MLRAPETKGLHSFGRLEAPGRIKIYEQPRPPWTVFGAIAEDDILRFERYGALVECRESPIVTTIDWPDDNLKEFMLFDVLLFNRPYQDYRGSVAQLVRAALS